VDLAGNPINDQAKLTQPDLSPFSNPNTSRPAASPAPRQPNAAAPAFPSTFKSGLFRMLAFEEEATGFGVQVGAYDDIYRLLEAMNSLSDKGYQNTLVQSGTANKQPIFRVLVGPYRSRSEADQIRKKLQTAKVKGIVVDLARLK
jgi:cell division septation protein DedD